MHTILIDVHVVVSSSHAKSYLKCLIITLVPKLFKAFHYLRNFLTLGSGPSINFSSPLSKQPDAINSIAQLFAKMFAYNVALGLNALLTIKRGWGCRVFIWVCAVVRIIAPPIS